MPNLSFPGVVPGVFGENVALATENLGKVGERIATHVQQMNLDRQDKERIDRETKWMQDWQNALTSMEDETLPDGRTRKKGLLLQSLEDSKDVTLRGKQIYEKMREQTLKGISRYQYDKLAPFIDRHYLSVDEKLITHEANQWDESRRLSTESNLKLKTLEASTIRESEPLTLAIDNAIETAAPYYSKHGEATRKILNQKIADDMAESSIISTLNSTQDIISVVATSVTGTSNIAASVTWQEYY